MRSVIQASVFVAFVAMTIVFNPPPEKHREKIRDAIAERSVLSRVLGVGVLTSLASTYHSVGVGSYTVINGHLVSIGVLGMVFVVQ